MDIGKTGEVLNETSTYYCLRRLGNSTCSSPDHGSTRAVSVDCRVRSNDSDIHRDYRIQLFFSPLPVGLRNQPARPALSATSRRARSGGAECAASRPSCGAAVEGSLRRSGSHLGGEGPHRCYSRRTAAARLTCICAPTTAKAVPTTANAMKMLIGASLVAVATTPSATPSEPTTSTRSAGTRRPLTGSPVLSPASPIAQTQTGSATRNQSPPRATWTAPTRASSAIAATTTICIFRTAHLRPDLRCAVRTSWVLPLQGRRLVAVSRPSYERHRRRKPTV